MIEKNTTKLVIFASFVLLLLPVHLSEAFTDTQGHYNEDGIDYLYEKGVIEGYSDGSYAPNNTINRAEFVKILIESKYPGEATGSNCFPDVAYDWYAKYVCYAKDLGIIDGYDDNYFRPANEINLAEALKVVLNTYAFDICTSCYNLWYEPYYWTAYPLDLLDRISTDIVHEVTRGEMAQFVYNVELYLNEQEIPSVNTLQPTVEIPSDSHCSDGFIYHEDICKPGLTDLNMPDDLNYYLLDEIYGTEIIWDDWLNYDAIKDVLDEIINDSMNDYEKAEMIANWVHKSKNYGSGDYEASPANDNADFASIFESEEGICFDAATITTAMLRTAGIPSVSKMISYDHILNLFYFNGYWYSTDTTFCFDKNDCSDVVIYDEDFVSNEYYTLYSRAGHYERSNGEYCDDEFCLNAAYYWNRMMPINNSSDAKIIFPSFQRSPNTDEGSQISCYLQETTNPEDDNSWDFFDVSFAYGSYSNIGYNVVSVPTIGRYEFPVHYRYICAETLSGDPLATYELSLNEGESRAVTVEDIEKTSEANSDDYNRVIDYLKESTEELGIRIVYE